MNFKFIQISKLYLTYLFIMIFLMGCDKEIKELSATGIIIFRDNPCSPVIQLSNGQIIIPTGFPVNFKPLHDEWVFIEFEWDDSLNNECNSGKFCTIKHIEQICKPVTEMNNSNIDTFGNRTVNILNEKITDKCIQISVAFGGGCDVHYFNLIKINTIEEPETPVLELKHKSNDVCQSILYQSIKFNLSDLLLSGKNSFILKSKNWDGNYVEKIIKLQ